MLKDAASNAKPTKYAQNKRHGMYEGTPSMMNLAPERCSAPNTAKGMAKHNLLKATILSRPPALHIETTLREISKNVARMIAYMWMPGVSPRALSRPESPFAVQKRSEVYTYPNGVFLKLRRGTPATDQKIEIGEGARERLHPCKPHKDGPPK